MGRAFSPLGSSVSSYASHLSHEAAESHGQQDRTGHDQPLREACSVVSDAIWATEHGTHEGAIKFFFLMIEWTNG